MADVEREKALFELQERYTGALMAMQRVGLGPRFAINVMYGSLMALCLILQLGQSERVNTIAKQKLELVLSELASMPETVPTYKQIGRA